MKAVKSFILLCLVSLAVMAFGSVALAEQRAHVDFYGSRSSAGIGAGQVIVGDLMGRVNIDNLGTSDLSMSGSVVYVIPRKFIIFEYYGGGGIDVRPATEEFGTHIVLGSRFLWFFSEAEYKLIDRGTTYRGGIRLRF